MTGAAVSGVGRHAARGWLPFLVALDTVLVAAVLVLAVLVTRPPATVPGGQPGAGASTGAVATPRGLAPATPDESPNPTPTPGPPRFRLPSANIACDMTADAVTCTIASITFDPPPVEGCAGTVGHVVVLDEHGVSIPCVPGDPPGVAPADEDVLFYGRTSTVGGYTCSAATNGVTCTDASGTGFLLARASLTMLR